MACIAPDYQVLLVEDSEDDVFFFERVARRAGLKLHITHAVNGLAAVEALKTHLAAPTAAGRALPDLVFLDLKMPEFNGFEVLAWIQQQPSLASLPIVVLSGSEDAADVRRATSLGARACFTKPIQAEQLLTIFKSHVNARTGAQSPPLSSNVGPFTPSE